MNWQLLQIDPRDIHAHWPLIRPGLEKVRIKGKAPWLVEDVYAAIVSGRATLHIGYLDNAYAGCGVLAINTDPFNNERSLLVWALYTSHLLALVYGLEDLKNIARRLNIAKVIFHSPRPGWERRMKTMGFHVKERVYEAYVAAVEGH